jgi:4-diphosphocytidyl-2-C-methyl-D-erythritol kinase
MMIRSRALISVACQFMRFHTGLLEPMQLFPPAKINLSFKILRRREDGYHEIETLLVPISLRDELTIEPNESGLVFSVDDPSLPAGEDNLVVRAARSFFGEVQRSRGSDHVAENSHGPGWAAGDAASTLLGLNQLYGGRLPSSRLTNMAAGIGSDVPFFLVQSAAWCRGRGEIVEPAAVPSLPLLLLKPQFGVSTAWAYQRWRDSRELPGVDFAAQSAGELSLQNDLERPVFEKHIFLAQMKGWLRDQPEVTAALMSGSGSTVFAVLRDSKSADAIAARAQENSTRALGPRGTIAYSRHGGFSRTCASERSVLEIVVRPTIDRGGRRKSATRSRGFSALLQFALGKKIEIRDHCLRFCTFACSSRKRCTTRDAPGQPRSCRR